MEVNVGDATIHYTDQGSGTPVLLVHGVPDARHSWKPLTDQLGEGVRIIAPDFPGFGDSSPFPEGQDISPKSMVTFWNDFLQALEINEPIVAIVHDFGGPWLLPWIAENPERVRGLLILNTLFQQNYQWHFWARIWQMPVIGEISMKIMNRPLIRWEMKRGSKTLTNAVIDETYDRINDITKRTVLRFYRAYANPEKIFSGWQHKLEKITQTIPTKIVWGDKDPYISKEFADGYGVNATHLPKLGHWHHITNPELAAPHLKALLK